ncbi:MAG TPA: phosphoribosylamine--glycine ligase [Nitrospiria bacterium]|jgi:phosphoribosylamine--glycine ligase
MKVLVIGGGGREHALVWKLSKSPLVKKLFAVPGNSGIQQLAHIHPISVNRIEDIFSFVKREQIDLTVVGPEIPLTLGIVDRFEREGRAIVGPTAIGAEIEGSKVFSKEFMERNGIPNAKGDTVFSVQEASAFFKKNPPPYVIKADGLAGGKGVIIAQSEEEATGVVTNMMEGECFGDAGKRCVVEEFLQGEEVSFIVLTDGEKICPFVSSQDYKRVGDGDQGSNTGGMGAFAPSPLISDRLRSRIIKEVIEPTIQGMTKEGRPYRGFLYAGLMISPSNNPKEEEILHVLEFNARLGDPEAQVILPLLKTDLIEVFLELANGQLKEDALVFKDQKAITVVMASKGYPGSYEKGKEIKGISFSEKSSDISIFHAGTQMENEKWYTDGGRVLAVTALGKSFPDAHRKVYNAVEKISFDGAYYRRDIAKKVLTS